MTPAVRRALARGALLAFALLAGACGAGDAAYFQGGDGALVLGTGSPLFVPIADGDRVEIIHGPQGGYHIWGSLLARGMGARLALTFTLRRLDDGATISTVETSALLMPLDAELLVLDADHDGLDGGLLPFDLPDGGGVWGIAPGSLVYVPEPAAIDGRRVGMAVTARGDDGRTRTDLRSFIAFRP